MPSANAVVDNVNENVVLGEVRDLNLPFISVSDLLSRIYKRVCYIREPQPFSFNLPLLYRSREERIT